MFLLKKPIQFTWNGNTIQRTCCLFMSDLLYNRTSDEDIDVSGTWDSFSEVLSIVKRYFGFNPFRDIGNYYITNSSSVTMDDLTDLTYIKLSEVKPAYEYMYVAGGGGQFGSYSTLDGKTFTMPFTERMPGVIEYTNQLIFRGLFAGHNMTFYCSLASGGWSQVNLDIQVLPEIFYQNGHIVMPEGVDTHGKKISVEIRWSKVPPYKFTRVKINMGGASQTYRSLLTAFKNSTLDDLVAEGVDNPYEVFDGDSGEGGGDGDGSGADIDGIDPAVLPDLPDISAISSGLMTVYMPTALQLNLLGDFLWSSGFDINDLKKLFADPMSAIIGLSILPISPASAGSKSVKFGDVDTGITMPYTTNQFVRLSCGSVRISEYVGCFMDYAPYVDIQIYLPGIGMRTLSPDDCMNETLTLTYHVDVLTGGCTAFIQCGSKGILYQFNGSLIANVPLTDKNYSGAIQNAVSAVMSGAGVIAGAVTGAAPLTAMSAVGLAQSAANTAINSKPTIERSGNMGGSAGLMSIQKPYVVINRPDMSVPRNINKFVGNTLNVTKRLNQCKGFTMVQFIHLDGVTATDNEKDELMRLLNEGVII